MPHLVFGYLIGLHVGGQPNLDNRAAFTDTPGLKRARHKVIRRPFKAQGTGAGIDILATRIEQLSVGAVSVKNAIVMLFRSGSGAAGQQADGLIGSGCLHRTGEGKSFVACALAQKACRDGYSAPYTRAQSLFCDLANGASRRQFAKPFGSAQSHRRAGD